MWATQAIKDPPGRGDNQRCIAQILVLYWTNPPISNQFNQPSKMAASNQDFKVSQLWSKQWPAKHSKRVSTMLWC